MTGAAALSRPAGGVFLSFEGGDGGGKSTQAKMLAETLRAAGREAVLTREPGGAPGAEEIRRLVLQGEAGRWSAMSELLLFTAARRDHLERTILPALARDAVVICDRFADSTRVYQSAARARPGASAEDPGAPAETVEALHALAVGIEPDRTLILELPPEEAVARALSRAGDEAGEAAAETRFEHLGGGFHAAVRDGFRRIAAAAPERCRMIDAAGTPAMVQARIHAACADLLPALTKVAS